MINLTETKIEKLDKIITIRMTQDDYNALLKICENRRSNVSDIIRTIVSMVVDIVKENNSKGN